MGADLLICTATDLESSVLRRLANPARVVLLRMGVGPVNAAHAVTLAITRSRPAAIIVCGIGGAYPESGLAVGDVVCADSECYGDLGATSPHGFLDMQALGFPIVEGPPPIYNVLPMQVFPSARRARFVTMSTCTGTDAAARAVAARTGGAVENMEGAAVAHVAAIHDIPAGELRGISNIVTDRDTATWRIKEAATAAQEALLSWIAQR
ncbi:MAG: futalosine hydrolase [Vicinamibacterales bacterium]